MKQLHAIILAIFAVGLSCTAAEGDVVIKEPGFATPPADINHTGSSRQESLSPSTPDASDTISGKQHLESWKIDYEVSGGFAGIRQQLNMSSDGRLIALDLKRKRRVEQQASPEQLIKIADALSKIDFPRLQATVPKLSNLCADCFQYVLTVVIGDQHERLHFDDVSLKDPACTVLIGLLSSTLNRSLIKQEP